MTLPNKDDHGMRIQQSGQLMVFGFLLGALLWAPAATSLAAQETPQEEATDSLRRELELLQAQLDSLRAVVERLQAQGREEEAAQAEGALEDLRAAARAAAGEADTTAAAEEGEQEFVGRQRSLQALNPEISLNADVFGQVDGEDAGARNFFAREFEISFQAALDPFSRAKVFLTHHRAGAELEPFHGHHEEEEGPVEGEEPEEGHGHGEGGGIELEEGYAEWVNLPGGFSVKVGRFFQQFGQLNRWHAHALPFQTRSLPHLTFIGEESLAQTGVSTHWLLPLPGSGTYEVTAEVTRSSNERLFGESSELSFLGHLNGFWQLTRTMDLDLGVSTLVGDHLDEATETETERRLYGVEGALTWRPPERAMYRGLTVRGGAMLHEGPLEDAAGAWGMAEVRLGQQWLAGARYDWVENPEEPGETAWLFSPTLTWWQSEWVRLRAEYDHLDGPHDTVRKFLIQVTFAMGPHKHETY